MITTISPQTLKQWLDKGEALLIDVREPAEYEAEHIPGAVLVPLSSVAARALPHAGGKKLVMQCRLGGRSRSACEKLAAENPALEIHNLEGGIAAWTAAGLPVEKKEGCSVLPLDRQVQLIVGLGVLAGTILGYAWHPVFLILAGFLGLGLTFAGVTGCCGLACLLARAPWNKASCDVSCHCATPKPTP